MKKRLQKMLAPNSVMFYVLFFLFAVVGLYFSRVYGAAGIVVCIILRIVSLRTNAARQRQVQELMNNIEVDGGEIRPAVTRLAAADSCRAGYHGEIVWANDAFAEISGRGTAVSGVRMARSHRRLRPAGSSRDRPRSRASLALASGSTMYSAVWCRAARGS